MSSAPQNELRPEEMRAQLARLLGRDVTGLERIGGGGNSRVYRAAVEGGGQVALKIYFQNAKDRRDRLATEFGSFTYLWANGFREIPQPLTSDPALGWAVYEFVEGEKIPPGQAGEAELDLAVDFLGRLRELSCKSESRKLGEASEACFAVSGVAESVRQRLSRLRAVQEQTAAGPELRAFLAEEFAPLLEQVTRWSESRLAAAGMSFTGELDWSERTLSPSDFGFHNALRRRDGRIIFLDFEYFGWDDPAKMISDFLLHPAMNLSPGLKTKFASAIFCRFTDWPGLAARVESVYPLFGLKWCMIFLNEFLPDEFQRRQFAAATATDRSTLQQRQLAKAQRMLEQIRGEYERFPYHD